MTDPKFISTRSKPSILIVTSSYPPSRDGTARLFGNAAEFLGGKGFSVTVVTRLSGKAAPFERVKGVTVTRLPSSTSLFGKLVFLTKCSVAIATAIREGRGDLIHSAGTTALAASVLGSLNTRPILVTFPGLPSESLRSGDPQRVVKARARRVLRVLALFPRFLTVPAKGAVAPVAELCGRRSIGKIRYIPNPIDVAKFSPSGRAQAKGQFPEILVVGGLRSRKGVGTLLQALPTILRSYPALRLTLVGGGSFGPALERQIEELGIRDSIRWAGEVSDDQLIEIYEQCDMVVVPSLAGGEAFGYVVAEAMCMRKPVIASATPGPMEIISEASCGVVFPPGDSKALAARIIEVAGDEKRRLLLGENGRRYAVEHFEIGKVMAQFEELYESAAGGWVDPDLLDGRAVKANSPERGK